MLKGPVGSLLRKVDRTKINGKSSPIDVPFKNLGTFDENGAVGRRGQIVTNGWVC